MLLMSLLFPSQVAKARPLTFFVAFLDDTFSNLDADFVHLLPQATSRALSGNIGMLTTKGASSHFRQTTCRVSRLAVLGF